MSIGHGTIGVFGDALVEIVVFGGFNFVGFSGPNWFGIVDQSPIPSGLFDLFGQFWSFVIFNSSIYR